MDQGKGPSFVSERIGSDSINVWKNQAGDKLGEKKVDGLHTGIQMMIHQKGGVQADNNEGGGNISEEEN